MKIRFLYRIIKRHSQISKTGFAAGLLLVVLMLVSVNSFASRQVAANISLHHFELPCDNCHADDWYQSDRNNKVALNDDLNRLCTISGCHDYDAVLNHPVGVTVTGSRLSGMKTDENSQLTCLTCHEQSNTSETGEINANRDRFLFVPDSPDFCASCHTNSVGSLAGRVHWQFSSKAHLGSILSDSISSQMSFGPIGDIDDESRTCLGCHDNIAVTIPLSDETQSQKFDRWKRMSDHPIGIDYTQIAMRLAGEYRFPLSFESRIRLFDGKVGCGSCHSLYADNKAHIVLEGQDDILCRTCHIK